MPQTNFKERRKINDSGYKIKKMTTIVNGQKLKKKLRWYGKKPFRKAENDVIEFLTN